MTAPLCSPELGCHASRSDEAGAYELRASDGFGPLPGAGETAWNNGCLHELALWRSRPVDAAEDHEPAARRQEPQ